MRRTVAGLTAVLVCCVASSLALQGTVLFNRFGAAKLYCVDLETGAYRLLVDQATVPAISGGFNYAYFSPDGRTISFFSSGAFWVMNNDGTGVRHVADWQGEASKGKHYIYTGTHIMWAEADGRHFRADVATGHVDSVYQVDENNGLFGSRDGRRTVCWSHPAELEALKQFGPVIDYSADFTSATHYRSKMWGHGWFVSGDGKHAVLNAWTQQHYNIPGSMWYGGHMTFAVIDMDVDTLVKTFPSPGVDQSTGTYDVHYVPNSNEHMVVQTCTGDCTDRDGHWWVINYRTEEEWEIPTTQITALMGDNNPNMNDATSVFLGQLPDLSATDPVIALSETRLVFEVDGPVQTVDVANSGVGTLTTVSVTVDQSGLSWLKAVRSGSGNAQTIANTVDTAGLAEGVYYATVEVSGGGAINTASYTVTLSVGAQMTPPSDLQASSQSVPPSVTLTWADNTDDEAGFLIERREQGGVFAPIAATAADVESFVDTAVAAATYEYRVRAFSAGDTSVYSPVATATVTPVPYALVSSPAQGETYSAGDTVHVRWTAYNLPLIEINYSPDDGETWVGITAAGGVPSDDPRYGNYPWVVPNVTSSLMIVRVNSYQEQEFGGNSGMFSVNGTGVRLAPVRPSVSRTDPRVVLFDCRGRRVAAGSLVQLRQSQVAGGVYVARGIGCGAARPLAPMVVGR